MERYDTLNMDLECDEGGVAQKAAIFGGMFKRTSRFAEPSAQAQDNLSVNSDISDSLSENNNKGGMFKGILKKTTRPPRDESHAQATISVQNTDLSASKNSLTDNNNSAKKTGVQGGVSRRPPKPAHERRPSQDSQRSAGSDSLSERDNAKEKTGVLGGMFRRSPKPAHERRPSQDYLSVDNELSASRDSLTEKDTAKEKPGVLGGIFRRSPKPAHERRPSQDYLSVDNELSASRDSLTEKDTAKEKPGVLGGIFRRSPKPAHERRPSQDYLSVDSELSASMDSLTEKDPIKEKGGMFGGMFRKSPRPLGARTPSQDDLDRDVSASNENLIDNSNAKDKTGMFGGIFKKPKPSGARSQEDLSAHSELSASNNSLSEKTSKGGVMGKILKNPFQSSTVEKKDSDSESEETTDNSSHKQNKLSEAMTKLNPFRSAAKQEKEPGSNDEEPPASNEESSGHKQKDTEETAPHKDSVKPGDDKTRPEMKGTAVQDRRTRRGPEDIKENKREPRERRGRGAETPPVPEEMNRAAKRSPQKARKYNQGQSDDEGLQESPGGREGEEARVTDRRAGDDEGTNEDSPSPAEGRRDKLEVKVEETKVRKPKKRNPFMPRATAQSDDEGLNEDESRSLEERKAEGEDGEKKEETKVRKPKKRNPFMPRATAQSDDEGLNEDESQSLEERKAEGEDGEKKEETKVRKPKKRNPFMPRATAQSDDEGLNEDESQSLEERKAEGEDGEKMEEPKVRKKKFNPFMPRSKPKGQSNEEAAAAKENKDAKTKSLFDQLEEFRLDGAEPGDVNEDVDGLMEWWNTVEQWDDLPPQDDDMTEKEEAKAFAVTADKVQKGIRVFNKLFTERAESLWQHVIDLHAIADALDCFNKKTKIAQITGGSTSALGGVATIAGLALAPVTMGTSLIVTAVGLAVATAGGLTSAGAGISNQVNNSLDRKKVEKIVEDYQNKMTDLNKCMMFIKQGIEHLRKFDLIRMKKHAYNRDFPALNNIYEDGAMAGKAILINANEIMRVVQIANVAGSTAARAVQIASMATGVLTGLFVGMDIYFVAKDSKELKKGAKSEFAAKIREVAEQLHEGLVELNGIRDELHSTDGPENTAGTGTATDDDLKKEKGNENEKEVKPEEDEEEDEIDRIKAAIKKDLENREYV